MDKAHRLASGRPSCSLDEQQNSLATPTQRAGSGASSDSTGSAAAAYHVAGRRALTTGDTFAAANATAAIPGVGWMNGNISPRGAPLRTVATSSASFAAAVGGVIDVDAGD